MTRDLIALNRDILLASVIVTVVSVLVFAINVIYPINQFLASSIRTPWGIATSIFVHGNLAHIEFNIIFLWAWTVFIVFENDILKYTVMKRDDIKRRLRFMIKAVFGSAILSSFLWLILRPDSTTLGSSGVVYALSGACLISSFMNISYVFKGLKLKDLHNKVVIVNIIGNLVMNIMVFLLIFFMFMTNTSSFFGFGDPQINSFVHWTSFIIAFFSVFAYEYYTFHLPTLIKNMRSYLQKKRK